MAPAKGAQIAILNTDPERKKEGRRRPAETLPGPGPSLGYRAHVDPGRRPFMRLGGRWGPVDPDR